MTLIAYVFPKLQTVKDVARQMSKESCFGTTSDSEHRKGTKILLKSEW